MGASLTVRGDALRKLERLPADIAKAQKEAVREVAMMTKTTALGVIAQDIGADRRLSGMRNTAVGVKFDIVGRFNPTALVVPSPPGPLELLEYGGRTSYAILSKKNRRKGRARGEFGGLFGATTRGFLGNPKAGFAAMSPVMHPPQKPRHTWTRAVQIAKPLAAAVWRRTMARTLARSWGS